jgi:hypothetical protein
MKTILWGYSKRSREEKLLHIEIPLGVINVTTGLYDLEGREVASVEVIPNEDIKRDGYANTRLIKLK